MDPDDDDTYVLDKIDELRSEIETISNQLRRWSNTDEEWRNRARLAIKHKERQIAELEAASEEEEKKSDASEERLSLEESFINVAREQLDPAIYDQIWKVVKQRQGR